MGTDNVIFLEVIEWFDETGRELVHRIPEGGSGEIKLGAQLIVRESQVGVLFYKGKAGDAFGPGRHTLTTANIPVLTKILAIPWGMTSPLRAEVYLANMKIFPNLKWGTRDPVAFKDSELGLIRLRAHGVFNIQVVQPVLFINTLVGTMGIFTTEEIEEYMARVIVSRFNDYLGEHLDSILNLPGRYDEISTGLQSRLQEDFRDLDKLVKMKAAMAMEKAAESTGEAGAGMGMGMGFMMPAMFADMFRQKADPAATPPPEEASCPDCKLPITKEAKFCPHCGHQQLVFDQCTNCSKNLPPNARFCSKCGHPADEKPVPKVCTQCKTENLPGSVFCNHCGEKIG
ncbi:MAG: SPFH domain-containing protein [Deltaproteobacteria bacterium]|nr:SPFH domain-containing protein [Deltaproteobacteria bacterium]